MDTKIIELFSGPIIVINIGLSQFAKSLEEQGVDVIKVDWSPPAGGDKEMMDLLDNLL
jgi:tRNA A-37 threonylcarbamoyl transferase component Bud32